MLNQVVSPALTRPEARRVLNAEARVPEEQNHGLHPRTVAPEPHEAPSGDEQPVDFLVREGERLFLAHLGRPQRQRGVRVNLGGFVAEAQERPQVLEALDRGQGRVGPRLPERPQRLDFRMARPR